ncbi:TetR/AcrR family transcriptional regulator [Paenibacillus sp. MWE-103]|uniref:TetR/AcrR family transcriptional regulator n=1 Tax=Paenibacillus artemisiicola TaxID=1172618 RepID=A0ABS3W930_9BACL|nr:TetR/AcrR family transcriptional regulator [Paenibacillus artemisiicola]MBO7744830.1 TetR/AcrR family transcriptional regulator [Paenibacillus artemisiicola]
MQQRNERKDAARHRELILDTASQLFLEHGVEGVSMHQIAKSAGVGQGTLYRRYSSKAELCLELMADSFRRFKGEIGQYFEQAAGAPVRERLAGFLDRILGYIEREIDWLNAIKPSAWCQEDQTNVYQAEPFVYVVDTLKALLDEAADKGEAPAGDAEFAAFTIAASFNPSNFYYLIKDRGLSIEEIKAKYIRFYDGLFFRQDG